MAILWILQEQGGTVSWDLHDMLVRDPLYIRLFIFGILVLAVINLIHAAMLFVPLVWNGVRIRRAIWTLSKSFGSNDEALFRAGLGMIPKSSPEYRLRLKFESKPEPYAKWVPQYVRSISPDVWAGIRVYEVKALRFAKMCAVLLIWSLVVLAKNLVETGLILEDSKAVSSFGIGHFLHDTFGRVGFAWVVCAVLLACYLLFASLAKNREKQWRELMVAVDEFGTESE